MIFLYDLFKKIKRIFLIPNTILITVIAFYKLYYIYKEDVIKEMYFENVFGETMRRILGDKEGVTNYISLWQEQIGILKYIISAVFWYLVINILI